MLRAAATNAIQALLGADRVVMLDVSQDRVAVGEPETDGYTRISEEGYAATAEVLETGRTLTIADALAAGSPSPALARQHGIASALLSPLAWGGEIRSIVVAVWAAQRDFSADEVEKVEIAAAQAAAGFARLEAEASRAAGSVQDRAVVRAANALNASLDLQEVLLTLVHEAAMALGADMAGVFLTDDEGGATATAGFNVGEDWHGSTIASGEGAAGRVLATGSPFLTSDYERDAPARTEALVNGARSALAVPMAWDGELRGVLSLGWRSRRRVDDDDLRTVQAIAGLATAACRNAEAYEHVQHVARTDALTGVLNHGAMQLRIREEIARARRDGTPLGAVILDLDDFKHVNDTRGHAAGDELLRRVARSLQDELRPYDQVARYGGDEFVLLLPGSDEEATAQAAERCRDAIGGKCSIGVAAWHDGLDADGLLEQADRALMLAKRTGKGRVAVANPEVERELALLQSRSGSPAAVQALAAAIEERDGYTHEQTQLVVRLSRGVAMMLGLPADDVERIANAALLHDVGKLAMPAELLHKKGPLTHEEWAVMSEHPIVGERILARTKELAQIAPIVRHAHEHWNGTGYPDGLEGTRIPVGSRVIMACEAYVAMTAERPYRPAHTPDHAVAELRAGAGSKFDREVVDALLDLLGHNAPQVPNRAAGVKLAAQPPREPKSRRSSPPPGWAPDA